MLFNVLGILSFFNPCNEKHEGNNKYSYSSQWNEFEYDF